MESSFFRQEFKIKTEMIEKNRINPYFFFKWELDDPIQNCWQNNSCLFSSESETFFPDKNSVFREKLSTYVDIIEEN